MTHSTVAQNRAHRLDGEWKRIAAHSTTESGDKSYGSTYRNGFTEQTIRKSHRMTGHDWHVFDADDNLIDRAHSLTWAKYLAAKDIGKGPLA